jgi:methylated-DNA-[protein]-cysteine S-methyltransferase
MLYTFLDSPVGRLWIAGTEEAVSTIRFARPEEEAPHPGWEECPPVGALRTAVAQLREYFAGRRRSFDLPLECRGTAFQCAVWQQLRSIPFGETISYSELARRVGRPQGSRAVAQANSRNPLPIVVPCHRVIAADGSPGGFSGGLPAKLKLLALEGWRF